MRVFFELGEEHETPHGWLSSGGEQTVIAPRVQAKNRGGRKAAEPIRFQPLAPHCGVQVVTDLRTDMDHRLYSSGLLGDELHHMPVWVTDQDTFGKTELTGCKGNNAWRHQGEHASAYLMCCRVK